MSADETSRKTYMYKCGICESEECDKISWHYCNQCYNYLCSACRYDHRILDDLHEHKISSGRILPGESSSNQLADAYAFDNVLDFKTMESRKVSIKLPSDKREPCISGCTFLPDGQLLICDYKNKKIKLLDSSLAVHDSLELESAEDIAVVDNNTAVVTMPTQRKLQFLYISEKLRKGRTLSFRKECYGVAVTGNEMFISFYDFMRSKDGGFIGVFDIDSTGNSKRSISENKDGSRMFQRPVCVAASSNGYNIYISDLPSGLTSACETDTVTCLNSAGDVIYNYGDLHTPHGLYVDLKGNVIVCHRDENSVFILTAGGKLHKTLLTYRDGLKRPTCVSFRPADGTLVFGCCDHGELCVFNITPD